MENEKHIKTDFLKKELKVGDSVIFMTPGYRELTIGRIIRMTDQKATIQYERYNRTHEKLQRYRQIIKI